MTLRLNPPGVRLVSSNFPMSRWKESALRSARDKSDSSPSFSSFNSVSSPLKTGCYW